MSRASAGRHSSPRPSLAPSAPRSSARDRSPRQCERSALSSPTAPASLALRVVDGDGLALAGASVALALRAPLEGALPWVSASCDSDGRVRFEDAPRGGELWLRVGAGDRVLPRVRAIAGLTPGEQRDLGTLALDGHELAGVVLGPGGEPLAGARIELCAVPSVFEEEQGLADLVRESRALLASDERGAFRLRGIPAGELLAAVRHPLGQVQETVPVPASGGLVLRVSAGRTVRVLVRSERGEPLPAARVALVDGRPRSLGAARRALLERGVAVDAQAEAELGVAHPAGGAHVLGEAPGYVAVAVPLASLGAEIRLPRAIAPCGRLLDADRAPFPGVTLRAQRVAALVTDSALASEARATTDAQGGFRLEGLQAGTHRIVLEGAGPLLDLGLHELRPDAQPLELLFDGARLEVLVRDEAGRPIGGAELAWVPPADGAVRVDVRSSGGMRTDQTGRAHALAPTVAQALAVRATGFAPARLEIRPADRRRAVVLARSGALAVRVVDAEERPLPGTALALLARDGEQPPAEARADGLGRATWSDLAPGGYTLVQREARGPWGEGPRPLALDLEPGSRLELEILGDERLDACFVLAREATLRVRVTSAGAPIAGARVALGRGGALEVAWRLDTRSECAFTDPAGWAVLPAHAPGNACLAVRAGAHEPAHAQLLDLPPGASTFHVELPGASVAGSVVDRAGSDGPRGLARLVPETFAGASRTRVLVLPDDGTRGPESAHPGEARARLDGDGAFRFERVPPGRYRILVECPGRAPLETDPVAVERDEHRDLGELALEPICEVTGVVEGLGPAPGDERDPLVLRLCTPDGRPLDRLALSADGPFRFAGVAPGRYRIDVERALALRPGEPFEVLPGAETFRAIDLRL